ncbi:HPr family phosphocarrier protein [Desulfoplanes sp.]
MRKKYQPKTSILPLLLYPNEPVSIMHDTPKMPTLERSLRITNKSGLHARPAALIAQTAQRFKAKIWIIAQDKKADAKSILDILCLAVPHESAITIKVCGQDATEAMESLKGLFETPFDEISQQA